MDKVIPPEEHPCFLLRDERGRNYYGASSGKQDRQLAQRLVRAVRDRPLDAKLLADVQSVHVDSTKATAKDR